MKIVCVELVKLNLHFSLKTKIRKNEKRLWVHKKKALASRYICSGKKDSEKRQHGKTRSKSNTVQGEQRELQGSECIENIMIMGLES